MNLVDDPSAISVFEKGNLHGSVKAIMLVKSRLLIVDFGTSTQEFVDFELPKSVVPCIAASSDGECDEITFAHQSTFNHLQSVNVSVCLFRFDRLDRVDRRRRLPSAGHFLVVGS